MARHWYVRELLTAYIRLHGRYRDTNLVSRRVLDKTAQESIKNEFYNPVRVSLCVRPLRY